MAKNKYKTGMPDYTLLKSGEADYTDRFYSILSYINYELDDKEMIKAAKLWIKKNTDYDTSILFGLPDAYFTSFGRFCFILLRGGELNPKHVASMHAVLNDLFSKSKVRRDDKIQDLEGAGEAVQPKKSVNIQDHMRDKANSVAGEIEFWLDEFYDDPKKNSLDARDIKALFTSNELKTGHLRFIVSFYELSLLEIEEVIAGDDVELKEAYSHISKPNIKKLRDFYKEIIKVADLMRSSTTKKPRLKRAVDKNKRVAGLNYQQKDEKLGFISVHPIHILGAKSVWYYNTKTRKVGVYHASDVSGLDVKGTSLRNYSGNSSEKTVRTSAKVNLRKFIDGKPAEKKKLLDDINSMAVLGRGRFNEHTIILSVDK